MAKITAETLGVKKTMSAVANLLIAGGAMELANWDDIVKEMQPKEGSTSNGPREITILKDIEGVQLGRKCSVTGLFYANDYFSKGATVCKKAEKVKGQLYTESKGMEKEANVFLEEARDITDVAEKVEKYEAYDNQLKAAKEHRNQPIEVTDEMREGGVETIEDLAANLGVEVNPVKPEEN